MTEIIKRLFKEIPSSLRLEEIKEHNQKLEDSLLMKVLGYYYSTTNIALNIMPASIPERGFFLM